MKIHIWTSGDPSVGIDGQRVTVDIMGWDAKDMPVDAGELRKILGTTFSQIFDEKAHVMFDAECAEVDPDMNDLLVD